MFFKIIQYIYNNHVLAYCIIIIDCFFEGVNLYVTFYIKALMAFEGYSWFENDATPISIIEIYALSLGVAIITYLVSSGLVYDAYLISYR